MLRVTSPELEYDWTGSLDELLKTQTELPEFTRRRIAALEVGQYVPVDQFRIERIA